MIYRTVAAGVVVVGAITIVAVRPDILLRVPLAERVLTYWIPPEVGETPASDTALEGQGFRTLGRQVRGRLIWASNRAGNHDLYEADLATGRIRQLTHHPHVDTFLAMLPMDGRFPS